MYLLNGLIYLDSCTFKQGHLFIENGIFSTITTTPPANHLSDVIDASDCYIIPGLIDIHLHGAYGYDFCDASLESIKAITQYELKEGITTLFPTTMTLPYTKLNPILQKIFEAYTLIDFGASQIAGIHLEGPYIAPKQCGAQNINYCKAPDIHEFNTLQEVAGGLIRYITLAPEHSNALKFIHQVTPDVIVSLGHTTASYDIAMEAFKNGASHVTHCYNAMPPLHHREPGLIGAAIEHGHAYIELICDGIHLHPAIIRQAFKLFDEDRIIFISDSMMATGLPDGTYTLGGTPIQVVNGEARTLQGQLAGSTTHLMDCLRKAVSFGIPLEIALKCVTCNPAREAGIFHQVGSITPGKRADCVILNKQLQVIHVIQDGQLIF